MKVYERPGAFFIPERRASAKRAASLLTLMGFGFFLLVLAVSKSWSEACNVLAGLFFLALFFGAGVGLLLFIRDGCKWAARAARELYHSDYKTEIQQLKTDLAAKGAEIEKLSAGILGVTAAADAEIERLKAELAQKDKAFYDACMEIGRLQEIIQSLQVQAAAAPPQPSPTVDFRYRKLRALLLHELHPDHAPAGSADRALRQEVFKALWLKVEQMEREAA